jgi:hypothetical protein
MSTIDQHGTTLTMTGDLTFPIDLPPWEKDYGMAIRHLFAQYPMHKGLRIFGDKGLQAIKKEMQQLHDCDVLTPVKPSDLTAEQRDRVLEYLMFLTEKRDGRIKGRGCADGRPQ